MLEILTLFWEHNGSTILNLLLSCMAHQQSNGNTKDYLFLLSFDFALKRTFNCSGSYEQCVSGPYVCSYNPVCRSWYK